jgi:hypothetical protein
MSSRRRKWVVTVAVVILLVAGCWLASRPFDRTLSISHYRVVDETTIRVGVTTSKWAWTRVTDVEEAASSVRITVKSLTHPLPQGDIGYEIELTVQLDRPLGDREVVDGHDSEVTRRL